MKSQVRCLVAKCAHARVGRVAPVVPFRRVARFATLLGCLVLPFGPCPLQAQQTDPSVAPKVLPASPKAKPVNSKSNYVPVTGEERWKLYSRGTVLSPGPYVLGLGLASVAQAANRPKEWGGGWDGYGKRVGSIYGIILTEETIRQSMAAALRTDPRYLRCDCKNGWHRSWNAIEMTLLTRDHRGRLTIDAAQIVGAYGSGMISATWYPSSGTAAAQGFRTANLNLALMAGINLVREFQPELKRVFGSRP